MAAFNPQPTYGGLLLVQALIPSFDGSHHTITTAGNRNDRKCSRCLF
jgi:hypothetical protein